MCQIGSCLQAAGSRSGPGLPTGLLGLPIGLLLMVPPALQSRSAPAKDPPRTAHAYLWLCHFLLLLQKLGPANLRRLCGSTLGLPICVLSHPGSPRHRLGLSRMVLAKVCPWICHCLLLQKLHPGKRICALSRPGRPSRLRIDRLAHLASVRLGCRTSRQEHSLDWMCLRTCVLSRPGTPKHPWGLRQTEDWVGSLVSALCGHDPQLPSRQTQAQSSAYQNFTTRRTQNLDCR
mmetsp:Transcript_55635/g.97130  ORF Transcript_55635/g.97130 Transcript_55635/m.97130 type:complete len:233 (+) Transcript_55635:162-860(+)